MIFFGFIEIAYADAGSSLIDRRLHCGSSDFVASTRRQEFFVVEQHLAVKQAGLPLKSIRIEAATVPQHRDPTTSTPGLSRWVEGWACRRTGRLRFVELLYTCSETMSDRDTDRYCSATRERTGFLMLDGTVLDRGYSPDDPRYRSLERGLGLPDWYDGKTYEQNMSPVD